VPVPGLLTAAKHAMGALSRAARPGKFAAPPMHWRNIPESTDHYLGKSNAGPIRAFVLDGAPAGIDEVSGAALHVPPALAGLNSRPAFRIGRRLSLPLHWSTSGPDRLENLLGTLTQIPPQRRKARVHRIKSFLLTSHLLLNLSEASCHFTNQFVEALLYHREPGRHCPCQTVNLQPQETHFPIEALDRTR
jgi:hypothetical protein